MSEKVETAAETAKRLLPCSMRCGHQREFEKLGHRGACIANYRPAVATAIEAAVAGERELVDWVLSKIETCHPDILANTSLEARSERLYGAMHVLSSRAATYENYIAKRKTDVGELQNEVERLQAEVTAAEQRGRETERAELVGRYRARAAAARTHESAALFLDIAEDVLRSAKETEGGR